MRDWSEVDRPLWVLRVRLEDTTDGLGRAQGELMDRVARDMRGRHGAGPEAIEDSERVMERRLWDTIGHIWDDGVELEIDLERGTVRPVPIGDWER